MFQLGFDAEAFGLVFASDYRSKVLAGEEGRETRGTVEKFLEKVLSPCTDLSFSKDKMIREFLFTDSEITYGKKKLFFFFLTLLSCSMEWYHKKLEFTSPSVETSLTFSVF